MRPAAVLLLAAAAAGAPAAAPVPKHLMKDGEDAERAKLQGRWKLEFFRPQGGREMLGAGTLNVTLEVRGADVTLNRSRNALTGKLRLGPADGFQRFTLADIARVGKDGAPDGKEIDMTWGYVLDGDKLTLASRAGAGQVQPADPTKPDKDDAVYVFVRVKPDPAK